MGHPQVFCWDGIVRLDGRVSGWSLCSSRLELWELGVGVRVSHISPKEGEIWGTLRSFVGTECVSLSGCSPECSTRRSGFCWDGIVQLEGRVFCWDRIVQLGGRVFCRERNCSTKIGCSVGTELFDSKVGCSVGTELFDSKVGCSVGTELFDSKVGCSVGTELFDSKVGCSVGTELFDSKVGCFVGTELPYSKAWTAPWPSSCSARSIKPRSAATRNPSGSSITQYSPRRSRLSMSRPGPGAAEIMACREPNIASFAVSSGTRIRTFWGSLIFISSRG
jgi:hypothetical protein